MKIVHISTYSTGGAGRAAYRIHEALLKNGVNSSFVSLDTIQVKNIRQVKSPNINQNLFGILKSKIDFRLRKHLGIDFNRERRIKTEHKRIGQSLKETSEISSLPFSDFNILRIPEVINADVIHLHWVAGFLDYPSFFKFNDKRIVWTLHDMNPFQGVFHYKEDEVRNNAIARKLNNNVRIFKKGLYRMCQSSMAIVTPSKWLLDECTKSGMLRKASMVNIPYPLDLALYNNRIDTGFRTAYKIPENNTVLLFVAQNVKNHRKGIDLLLEALEILKNSSITLFVLGSGDVNIEGIDVQNLGQINKDEDIAYFYSNSDAFILPSREDNLPNVMLESLACGTPVIGFAVGGLKEHITDYKTGLLAKELNSDSLSEVINEFCSKKSIFDREKIRKYAVETFDEIKVAEEYKLVYSDLLKGKSRNA